MTSKKSPGAQFRDVIQETHDLDGVAAERLLDEIASTIDELAALEEAARTEGPLISGARGQRVANPVFGMIARHRAMLARLLRQLFPTDDVESQSSKAARAARARWRRRRSS